MKKEMKQLLKQENETVNALSKGLQDLIHEHLQGVLVALHKEGISELTFDYENGDAPSCIYVSDNDYCDTYIKHIKFDEYGYLTKIDAYLYYVRENINNARERDLMNYELGLYNFIVNEIQTMRYKVQVIWKLDSLDEKEVNYLPSIVAIPYDVDENDVCNYLSDKFGFLVQNWTFVE